MLLSHRHHAAPAWLGWASPWKIELQSVLPAAPIEIYSLGQQLGSAQKR